MEKVGKYKILGKLGQGGMGVVYKALDPLLERVVALKTISGSLDSEPDLRVRFFREGRSAASLSHKNIITVYDLGEDSGMAYLAMEYLDGEDLRKKIHDRKLRSLGEKLAVMIEVCEGLAHAHSRDIIHRDIKPANIFITHSGQVKILDFGLARVTSSELTRTGAAMGSPNYMSPEQVRGENVDRRADIFSAGALFYELLTSHKPFDANSVPATIVKILQEEPEPLERVDPSIDPKLAEIVEKALEKDPGARYQDVDAMLGDLRKVSAQVFGTAWVSSLATQPIGEQSTAPPGSTSPNAPNLAATLVDTPVTVESRRRRKTAPTPTPVASGRRLRAVSYVGAAFLLLAILAVATYWSGRNGALNVGGTQTQSRNAVLPPVQPTKPDSGSVNISQGAGSTAAGGRTRMGSGTDANIQPDVSSQAVEGGSSGKSNAAGTPSGASQKASFVAQGNAHAKSLMSKGRYEEAAARVREVLGVSPGDAEALRLVAQLNAYAQESSTEALNRMLQSKRQAEEAAAAKYAPKSLEAAADVEREARRLYDEKRYGEAAAKLHTASGLYLGASGEAQAEKSAEEKSARLQEEQRTLGLQRQLADSSRRSFEQERLNAVKADAEARAPQRYQEALGLASEAQTKWEADDFAGAKTAFDTAAAAMRQAKTTAQELNRAPASPAVEAISKTTIPASPAPVSADVARSSISAVLQQYISSLRSKDLQKLHEIWPGLGGQQEKALREEFSVARQIQATFGDIDIKIAGDTATATARRSLSMLTVDGQRLQSEVRTTVTLKRAARSWVIDGINFEPIR